MNSTIEFAASGVAITIALVMSFHLLMWIGRQQTLAEAEQISRSLSNEGARLQEKRELIDKLLHYRLSKVRASFGAPTKLIDAAADLIVEYRLSGLEKR